MKYLVLFLVAATAACTSSTTPGANGSSPNSNAAVNVSSPENPTLVTNVNGAQNLNPNAFNGNNADLKVVPYKPKEGELPYGTRYAPDESTMSTTSRGRDFVEIRTFKNHPQLVKVEKIMDGKTNRYKVFLKNGKVLDGTEEKLANMASMAPISILEAVGIKPPAPATPANVESKK